MMVRPCVLVLVISGLLASLTRADDPPVSLADFAAYLGALSTSTAPQAAQPVTFRALWDHPTAYQGVPVLVEGRLVRLFRQPAVGQFPPLAEAWITSPLGEPTCLVFPTASGSAAPSPGDQVRFVGTFLRRVGYQGGDTKRVAPLIVGPALPDIVTPGTPTEPDRFGPIFGADHAADWGIGLAAALGVLALLVRRHLDRPPVVAAPVGPPPVFLDEINGSNGFDPFDRGGDHDDDQ